MNPFSTDHSSSVPSGRRSPFLTYAPYFGLAEKPFSLSADPRFLYKSPSHTNTFHALLDGIRRREGLIVRTGDIGTGKTTLCRAGLEQLDRKTFSSFVRDPFASREDLLKMLLLDFGVMSVDDLKGSRLNGASRAELSYPLYEFLNSLVPLQAFAVLIIDEAQNLSLPLLEELRILSDLEAPKKLLQVVLVGQLEFRTKLKLPEMRQLDQRVSVRCNLEPLSRDGVAGYITHRLGVAGGAKDRIEFTTDAIDEIYRASKGVPRVINLVCDHALQQAFQARTSHIDADIVSSAAAHLGLGELTPLKAEASLPRETTAATEGNLFPVHAVDFHVHDLSEEVHAPSATATSATRPEINVPTFLLAGGGTTPRLDGGFSLHRWRRRTRRLGAVLALLMVAVTGWGAFLYVRDAYVEIPSIELPPAAPAPLATQLPALAVPSTPAEIVRPPLTPGGSGEYFIDVAVFDSVGRATRLVEGLTASDYRARTVEVDLAPDRRAHVVYIGGYATREDAEPDLARIRDIAGYADANVIVAPPWALPKP